jgi:hypothetical protein
MPVKPYKFYFASSFARKPEIVRYAKALNGFGNEVTSRWLFTPHEADVTQEDELNPEVGPALQFAREDVQDIMEADAVVWFSSTTSDGQQLSKGRGGRHTEFGLALAFAKPIYLIGMRENAFHAFVPNKRIFYSFNSFILGRDYVTADLDEFFFQKFNQPMFPLPQMEN